MAGGCSDGTACAVIVVAAVLGVGAVADVAWWRDGSAADGPALGSKSLDG